MSTRRKRLAPGIVEPRLRGRFGRPYLWSEACRSTQDVLRGTEAPEGAVALTEHQTAGRGREGRRWEDVAGTSLLFSLLLRPPAGPPAEQLSLVAGLAVAEAVEETRDAAGIKWPNDVLLRGRKVAGVLLEAAEGVVVCGVGVNVLQAEDELPVGTPVPAGSLLSVTGRAPDRAELLVTLLEILEHRYDAWRRAGLAPMLDELEARNVLRGRRVEVGGERGVAGPIATDGRLTLGRDDGTTVLVGSGEVVTRPT
ncbi:MAG: biotin--[acetyl-CoA-carboxylase] ligase [Gaiella sp.]|nr:biotin--[acetyl-CoA-carboxylase] ligase [Gaiella sp.]